MPLNDSQREHLTNRLREERDRLNRELGRYREDLDSSTREEAGELSNVPFHPADEGTDSFEREMDAQEMTRLSNELAVIDEALERMYKSPDQFGIDASTGEDIPFERLDVIPWATATVDRAARQEPAA